MSESNSSLPWPETAPVAIIGGGLAGCECALALARAGVPVTLFEMKPERFSAAHLSPGLAELVCSNSLRSDDPDAAVGMLKAEMRQLGSIVMQAAAATAVPAGKALAVDRALFSAYVSERVAAAPAITLVRREILDLDDAALARHAATVLAAGPLVAESLSQNLASVVGAAHLYFYDAIAPIVAADSIDMDKAFRASRYDKGGSATEESETEGGDYINCPMDEATYQAFVAALIAAEKVQTRDFEKEIHFEGCMPIEALAARGPLTLAYGPFKPVGLRDPRTGARPSAVLQLRAENREKSCYNLVGCQTKLKYAEQERVFRLVPGLEHAEFLRLGAMHRNTFVNAPQVLAPGLELKTRPGVYLAGQITGVEGYVESAACGLWVGLALAASRLCLALAPPPPESALGALLAHLGRPVSKFQPSNVNYGLMTPPAGRHPKKKRKELYGQRGRACFQSWLCDNGAALTRLGLAAANLQP